MSELKVTRTKKVYRGHHYPSYKKHPVIILKGLYLEKLGFQIGDLIVIEMSNAQIVITKETSKEI